MHDIASKSEGAAHAYKRGDYARAMMLLDEVIDAAPHSSHGLGSRILRASAYESGRTPSGKSLEIALSDFEFLANSSQEVGSVGIVGVARVLGQSDIRANADKIMGLCSRAAQIDGAPDAALVAGDVFALAYHNEDEARLSYREALRSGEKRGLIKIAMSYEREGMKLRSALYAFRYLFALAIRRFTTIGGRPRF